MSESNVSEFSPGAASRVVAEREPAVSAAVRSGAYALFSDLLASPHDVESAVRATDGPFDIGEFPYSLPGVNELIADYRQADLTELKSQYSSLFEVGSEGPPVPIREDLRLGQKAGVREELIRFYDFFGYKLAENFAWAPDHLSVLLEFMYFLCYSEASGEGDLASFQLAQADFSERHLINWVPALAYEVAEVRSNSIYARVLTQLSQFLLADLDWQEQSISTP